MKLQLANKFDKGKKKKQKQTMRKMKFAHAMAVGLLFTFSLLAFNACEEALPEEETTLITPPPPPPPNEGHDTLDTTAAEIIPLSPAAIPINSCMSVIGGVLTFSDDDCFNDAYESILNHTELALNNWEASYGFSSLWTHYDMLEADPAYDDMASDDLRNPDEYFERMLNSDHKVTIGNNTYQYDFVASTVTITDNVLGTVTVEPIEPVTSNKRGWTCDGNKNKRKKGDFASGARRIRISKHRRNKFGGGAGRDYSHIFMKMCNYKKNWLGIWKKEKNDMTAYIDRWNELRLERTEYTSGGVTMTGTNKPDAVYKNRKWKADNQKSVTWSIHSSRSSSSNLVYLQACAVKWERIHAYTDNNFNDDVHHDDW